MRSMQQQLGAPRCRICRVLLSFLIRPRGEVLWNSRSSVFSLHRIDTFCQKCGVGTLTVTARGTLLSVAGHVDVRGPPYWKAVDLATSEAALSAKTTWALMSAFLSLAMCFSAW